VAAILAAEGIGWLAGGVALLRVTPRRPLVVASAASAVAVVPTVLLAVPAPLAVIVVAGLFAGVTSMLFNTLFETTLQRHIPRHALSRVSSYDWFGSLALQPIGLALMGPLASAVKDIRTLGPFPEGPAAAAASAELVNERAGA
jgi:hypothetical protein